MRLGPHALSATPVAPSSRPGWRDRLLAWRHRLIASPRFQRFAAAFPLTRPTAHRNARALFDLCAGFVYAQVLAACLRLDLFRILADGPMTPTIWPGASTCRPTGPSASCAPPPPWVS